MPVTTLLVEGDLDAQLLQPIFNGSPLVVKGGSKNSLPPQVLQARRTTRANVCYLRDRDFDSDPPQDATQPVVDRVHQGSVLGWHWCRHEIENYLLEPELVARATGWDQTVYVAQLLEAGRRIRFYQIGRWVVGTARRSLPPHYELQTRPEGVADNEFRLPADLAEEAVRQWVRQHTAAFFSRVEQALASHVVEAALVARATLLTEALLASAPTALLWCSAKDLLTALEPWLRTQGTDAGALRARVRDWVRSNPEETLNLLPEWNRLLHLLRA
jgi:hypothetical protein